MKRRTILIFPKFDNGAMIQTIRKKYDPLVHLVPPHISLVFPFESDITKEGLKEHICRVLNGFESFKIKLQGVSGARGNYLFLNVQEGKEELIEIHERLYTGPLQKYQPEFLKEVNFLPHLTLGNIEDDQAFNEALKQLKDFDETFETVVDKISVEIIDQSENSILEFECPIGQSGL